MPTISRPHLTNLAFPPSLPAYPLRGSARYRRGMKNVKGRHWGPNRLWYYRKRFDLTQRQAAEILGDVGVVDLSHLEHGHRLPALITALKLEILYRTPVSFLFPDLYAELKKGLREREDQLNAKRRGGRPLDLRW